MSTYKFMENGSLQLSDARILFKNFSGEPSQYNESGSRTFDVYLEDELAAELSAQGWNVKYPKENPDLAPEQDTRQARLRVVLSDGPEVKHWVRVYVVDGDNVKPLDITSDKALSSLDKLFIDSVDAVIRPYNWTRFEGTARETSGVKAYVSILYVRLSQNTAFVDPFAEKYGAIADEPIDLV